MSLQKCPNCKKHFSYWKVYKHINLKKPKMTCKKCHSKLKLKWKTKTFSQRLLSGFAWMGLPLFLVILVAMGHLNAFVAMGLVVLFHFAGIHYIIKKYKFHVVKK